APRTGRASGATARRGPARRPAGTRADRTGCDRRSRSWTAPRLFAQVEREDSVGAVLGCVEGGQTGRYPEPTSNRGEHQEESSRSRPLPATLARDRGRVARSRSSPACVFTPKGLDRVAQGRRLCGAPWVSWPIAPPHQNVPRITAPLNASGDACA